MKSLEKNLKEILLIGFCLILISPFILTRKSCIGVFDSTTGVVGDTIGGITAPIIGLITILLVYITYASQKEELEKTRLFIIKQNDSIELDQTVNSIENLLKETSNFINEIEWNTFKGLDAIRSYDILKDKDSQGNPIKTSFLDDFNAILIRFEVMIKTSENIKIHEVKINYQSRIYTLFYSKILWNTKDFIFDERKEELMNRNDDARLILPKYVNFSLQTLGFMITQKLAQESLWKNNNIQDLKNFLIRHTTQTFK